MGYELATVDGKVITSGKVYMPGTTVVVPSTAKGIMVAPVWDDRFEFIGLYRNPSSETDDVTNYTNSLADDKVSVNGTTTTVKSPATTTALTASETIPVGAEFEIGAAVQANIPYADGKYANAKTVNIEKSDVIFAEAAATATSGKITWHAYDFGSAISLNTTDADEKAALAKGSEYVSFDGNKIKGVKDNSSTKTWIYPSYRGSDGNDYAIVSGADHIQVTVTGELDSYTVDASKLLQVTDTSGTKSNSIELGQTVETAKATNGLSIKRGLLAVPDSELQTSTGNKIVWTYDKTKLKIDDNGTSTYAEPVITALATGTTTVKVQYIDKNGAKSNEASVTLNIIEPSVKIVWTDAKGNTVASPSGEVLTEGTDTNLYFRVLDKAGNDINPTGATIAVTSSDSKIIGDNTGLTASNNVYQVVGTAGSA